MYKHKIIPGIEIDGRLYATSIGVPQSYISRYEDEIKNRLLTKRSYIKQIVE